MAQSKIYVSLDALNDILFGYKYDIRATNIQLDQNSKIVHLTVEGDDVPDSPQTKLTYQTRCGRLISVKDKRRVKNPVREVSLAEIKPA